MSAYAVAKALSRDQRRTVAANAVDSVLRLLESRGIVQRIETARAYAIVPGPIADAARLCLLCARCGRATLLDDKGVARRLETLARATDFAPRRIVVEVIGLCAGCVGLANGDEGWELLRAAGSAAESSRAEQGGLAEPA